MNNEKVMEHTSEDIEEEKKSLRDWVIEHKTQFALASIGVVGLVATIVGIKNKDALAEVGRLLRKKAYPICNACGEKMTGFDGDMWYTCKECGNRVRKNDNGTWTWHEEISHTGSKVLKSDYQRADFCHGWGVSED